MGERRSGHIYGMISWAIIFIIVVSLGAGAVLIVCQESCNYSSIQSAIDNASPGDTVEVHSGIYMEHLEVDKGIRLIGMDTGSGLPVIDGEGYGSVITVDSEGVDLQGFNVTDSGHCGCGNAGIKVLSNNSTISGNTITHNKYGVYCTGNGNVFFKNDIEGNDIDTYDQGKNLWDQGPGPLEPLLNILGLGFKGNHYGSYDEPGEGCQDENVDGICDTPLNISDKSLDRRPLVQVP